MKIKLNRFLLLSIAIFIAVTVFIWLRKNPSKIACNAINADQAISIVKQLPEVIDYFSDGDRITKNQTSKAVVDVDSETSALYTVHVYSNEQYPNDPDISGHAATFNWYAVDKCSGEIKCSFSFYDDTGKFTRVTNGDEYPCD